MIEIDSKSNNNKPNLNLLNKELNKNYNKEKDCLDTNKGIIRSSSYGEIVPSKCELNCYAPIIPYQYQKIFNINKISNQENIGHLDNFIYSFSLMEIQENTSYMTIYPPPHILL